VYWGGEGELLLVLFATLIRFVFGAALLSIPSLRRLLFPSFTLRFLAFSPFRRLMPLLDVSVSLFRHTSKPVPI
jgi:hypothetical protein